MFCFLRLFLLTFARNKRTAILGCQIPGPKNDIHDISRSLLPIFHLSPVFLLTDRQGAEYGEM